MSRIRIAIVGVGNCANALMQGIAFYRQDHVSVDAGIAHQKIGGYGPSDFEVVAAFDVDRRKVGRTLALAAQSAPTSTQTFFDDLSEFETVVLMGPVLDGVAEHMSEYPESESFRVARQEPVNVEQELRNSGAEVLVCYLPVGADQAVAHYAEACINAGVAMVNCVPTFIASSPDWAKRFRDAGVPIIGDDIKSQLGATMLHRQLAGLFSDRGMTLDRTYQLNTGGNTDFLNMLDRKRLSSKKHSKTESVQSQLSNRLADKDIHIGPSDYVPWQKDTKNCFIRLEGRGFGGLPVELELRLSVQDSPNSAGVVVDAIRCAHLARTRGLAGPVEAPCACYMKSPPVQMRDGVARQETEIFIEGSEQTT